MNGENLCFMLRPFGFLSSVQLCIVKAYRNHNSMLPDAGQRGGPIGLNRGKEAKCVEAVCNFLAK